MTEEEIKARYKTGDSFTAYIGDNFVTGKIYIGEDRPRIEFNRVFFCSNDAAASGNAAMDKLGYSYSWMYDSDVTSITITPAESIDDSSDAYTDADTDLPKCNFGIVVREETDAFEIKKIADAYYPTYVQYPGFNATSNHVYYTTKNAKGAFIWDHRAEGKHPKEVTEILTLKQFKEKYLKDFSKETPINNNYSIY